MKTIQPDTFKAPFHVTTFLRGKMISKDKLLESVKFQSVTNETSVGMTNLTKIQIDTGNSKPVSQKLYPIAMKHCDWIKDKINKLSDAKVIHSSYSSWSAPIIVVPNV